MAFDEALAQRVREALAEELDVSEQDMSGGRAFLVRGNMACGVVGEGLMVRVGADRYEEALRQPHARETSLGGRTLVGFVSVEAAGFESEADLRGWVMRGTRHARSLRRK